MYAPYYIGKGTNERVKSHKYIKNTRHKKDATTKGLLECGHQFDDLFLKFYVNSEDDAYKLEEDVISEIGLDNLCNISPGGVGGSGKVRKGKTYKEIYGSNSDEIAAKISKSNTGKKHTDMTKILISNSNKLYFSNEENRLKHSDCLKGRKMPLSQVLATSIRFNGKPKSEETKRRMSESAIGKHQSNSHIEAAANARAKYKGILTINGVDYEVIRSTFNSILKQHNKIFNGKTFYKIVKDNSILEDQGCLFKLKT